MYPLPLILCIDVEPDVREINLASPEPWQGFVECHRILSEFRPRFASATAAPVHFNWFVRMDPQVEHAYGSATFVKEQFADLLADLKAEGDEIGLHVHASRWDANSNHWTGDYGDGQWVSECITKSFASFEEAFGESCQTVSFGDRWSNNESVALVERLGARYFLSVEPGARPSGSELGYPYSGAWPDYNRTPKTPYRPAPHDYRIADKRGRNLWIVPLTAGKYEGAKAFRLWRLKRLAMSLGIEGQREHESTTLRLHIPTPEFGQIMEGVLRITNPPHLAFVVRSEAPLVPRMRDNFLGNLNLLLTHPLVNRFRFTTPAEAIQSLGL